MVRIYLAIIGVLYLLLAVWCSVQPERTSDSVGYTLRPGSGQSEFLTVYGGLEFALAAIFLLPLVRPEATPHVLIVCLIVHASLALFRTVSLVIYSGISQNTYAFGVVEWVLLIATLAVWWLTSSSR